jgi:hypothetical protein
MMRRMAFEPPSATDGAGDVGGMKFREVRIAGTSTFQMEPIPEPRWAPDLQVLRVRAADLGDLENALQWFVGESFMLGKPPECDPGKPDEIVEFGIRGRLRPDPSPADLRTIVEDYRLLGGRFPSWQAVLGRPGNEVEHTLLEALCAIVSGLRAIAVDLGSFEGSKRAKQLPVIPEWCRRVIAIRAALAKKG